MKKVLLSSVLVASLLLQGCGPAAGLVTMPLNIMAAGALSKSAHERRADKCAAIETDAEKRGVTSIERRRLLNAVNCPV